MGAVIPYNASTGSDTAPSDTEASGGSSSGTSGGSSITLGTTADLSGCAQDGTDYIWVNTSAGQRHLYQVTGVTGTWAAATAVDVSPNLSTTFSSTDWYVNGTRQTMNNDTSQRDSDDWEPGWTAEFASGTYSAGSGVRPGQDHGNFATTDEAIVMRAAAGATTKPIIESTASGAIMGTSPNGQFLFEGLKFLLSSGAGTNSYVLCADGSHVFVDCVIDAGGIADYGVFVGVAASLQMTGCYITGGAEYGVWIDGDNAHTHLINCTLDGQGQTYFTTAAIKQETAGVDDSTLLVDSCLIFDSDGQGIDFVADARGLVVVKNCTIVDCAGDGIECTTNVAPEHAAQIFNNIVAYNGAYGIAGTASGLSGHYLDYNAVYSNTSGAYDGNYAAGANDITLTGDPFTNRSANDYTLNDTAGAGAALKGAALSTVPDGS